MLLRRRQQQQQQQEDVLLQHLLLVQYTLFTQRVSSKFTAVQVVNFFWAASHATAEKFLICDSTSSHMKVNIAATLGQMSPVRAYFAKSHRQFRQRD